MSRLGTEQVACLMLDAYEFKLDDVAKATGFPKETLRVAVQAKYLRWVRANTRPPTLPTKA